MPKGKARYGVTRNPFSGGPLDPFRDTQASTLRLRLDGFKDLGKIRAALQRGRQESLPVFVLVSGPSGSGRSSLENAILETWCEVWGIDLNRFTPVRAKAVSESELDLIRGWAGSLSNKLSRVKGLPAPELLKQLDGALATTDIVQLKARLQGLLPQIHEQMLDKAKPSAAGIGACFVNVRKKMLDTICSLFEDVPRVCVLTASEGEPFDNNDLRLNTEGVPIHTELGPLTGDEISDLLQHRWGGATPVPFELTAFMEFFKGRRSYIGHVLSRAEALFEIMCAANGAEGGSWGNDQALYYGPDQVRDCLDLIERGILPK